MPEIKATSFDKALSDLGKATLIYGTRKLNIQSKAIRDDTGTAIVTQGEIPVEISEMIKSALNSIGGQVLFIPFNPKYMIEQFQTGYSKFENKIPPDVVITGGITEFDRGLETEGENLDFDVETRPFSNAPKWFPGNTIGFDASMFEKSAFSRITIDFNLIDFKTMSGVPKMQAVNTVKVHKAVAEKELGFTLFGPTFGLKGTIKKVQGRHAAVRLLVQLSMIQMVGKYLNLPYWNLLPDAEPDPVVIDAAASWFYRMNPSEKIFKTQEYLYIQGYDVSLTGVLDQATLSALKKINPAYAPNPNMPIDVNTFIKIYTSVPVSNDSLNRRYMLASLVKNQQPQKKELSQLPSLQAAFVYRPGGNGSPKPLNEGAVLHSGDYYKIIITPLEDCWLYIFQADSSGKIFQLFPMQSFNGVVLNNFNPVRGKTKYTIPAENKSFFLDNTAGREKIWLVASRERNMEIESLYAELSRGKSTDANQRLYTRLEKFRGVQAVVSDKPIQVAWKETGEIFSIITQRLDSICKNCAYALEFTHK